MCNCVLFERTEVKLFFFNDSINILNTKGKMDISLISTVFYQGLEKNENFYAQNSASCAKSTNDEYETASLLSVNSSSTLLSMNIECTYDIFVIKNPCNECFRYSMLLLSKIWNSGVNG